MATTELHRSNTGFTFLHAGCHNGMSFLMFMTPALFVELFAGFLAGCLALWFVTQRFAWTQHQLSQSMQRLKPLLEAYLLKPGLWASAGLLALRLSIGVMMIHHGQEKLADPQQFASTYVASLHLPFPLVFAYVAGLSELIGSWLVISGLLTPIGAMALTGTMAVAAFQHILTAGFNIYVLELVTLYLGGSIALLLIGPGRLSMDAAIAATLLTNPAPFESAEASLPGVVQPVPVQSEAQPNLTTLHRRGQAGSTASK